jgi:hypothetical protein
MRFLIVMVCVLLAAPLRAESSKPVIAVGEITSAIQAFNTMSIQLAIENALTKTGKYSIMERTRLASLLEERGLSMSGITNGNDSMGGFSGVDYLVYGSVSNVTVEQKNLLIMLNCDATLSMNVRVVDVNSGEIRFSENITAEETVGTSPTDGNPCAGISLANVNVIGEQAADGIANKMTTALFPIKVARVARGQAYLNYGEGTLQPGEFLSIKVLGEGFVDPDTGEVLGADETTTGILEVVDVRSGFSIADIVYKESDINVGDVAQTLGDGRSVKSAVKRCSSDRARMRKDCDKDSGSKRCERGEEKAETSCAALLSL